MSTDKPKPPYRKPSKLRIGLGLVFAIACLIGFATTQLIGSSISLEQAATQAEQTLATKQLCNDYQLAPVEVVKTQMKALAKCQYEQEAINRVFDFASPSNKLVTGPIGRFEAMVWKEPYRALIENRGWVVGKAVINQGHAAVQVTIVDIAGNSRVFRFLLTRQMNGLSSRWMTDGVFMIYRSEPSNTDEEVIDSVSNRYFLPNDLARSEV